MSREPGAVTIPSQRHQIRSPSRPKTAFTRSNFSPTSPSFGVHRAWPRRFHESFSLGTWEVITDVRNWL